MGYSIAFLDERVEEQLGGTTRRDQLRILGRIQRLAEDPFGPGTAALSHGLGGCRKLRVGEYRVVFEVDQPNRVVLILTLPHRRHAYEMAAKAIGRR